MLPGGAPTTDDDDDDGRVAWLGTTDDDEDAGRFAWRPEEPLALWGSGEGSGYRRGSGVDIVDSVVDSTIVDSMVES